MGFAGASVYITVWMSIERLLVIQVCKIVLVSLKVVVYHVINLMLLIQSRNMLSL